MRLQQFDEAIKSVTDERGKNYGHPSRNFRRAAALQAVVEECRDPLARVALANIVAKVARLIETPDHLDSWVDIAGYARCGVMVTEREDR
jgi:hypothetical protein